MSTMPSFAQFYPQKSVHVKKTQSNGTAQSQTMPKYSKKKICIKNNNNKDKPLKKDWILVSFVESSSVWWF